MPVTTTASTVFLDSLADALHPQAAALAARWRERAVAAAPRPPVGHADGAAEGAVRALLASLRNDARWLGEVMRAGWEAGAAAHGAGLAPHHVLTDAELLVAVVLSAAEQAAAGGIEGGTAADGIAAARRLQRAGGLYTHAAVSSFLHAIVAALRARYRVLRHDLRNPIGTIRGALSLMEDETVPLESRLGPNVRAMVVRNAVSLDRLVSSQLADDTVEAILALPREVSLRDLALATRRALREPSRLAGCDIVVAEELPAACIDAVALELTLSALLLAGLACARESDRLRVAFLATEVPDVVVLRVVHERSVDARDDVASGDGAHWDLHGLQLAASVAAEFGARIGGAPPEPPPRGARGGRGRARHPGVASAETALLTGAETLYLELPVHGYAETPHDTAAASRAATSPRHQRDDLARAD